jgi:hypothetical protein
MQLGFTYYQARRSPIANFLAKLSFNKKVLAITQKHGIEGFTLLKALGAWQGKTEPSYQLLLEGVPKRTVRALARDFRDSFSQDAVMLKDGKTVEFI